MLKKLRRDAEAYFNEPVTRAVITVPAYFNDAQRNATKKAGELAGFTVERIINEPTAAALAYGLDKLKEHSRIAVYDLGGGTFDLSILELNDGVFQVLATNGNTRLGGDDLDRRLVDFLVEKIKAAGGPDAARDLPMLSRIREAAEQAKIKLSSETEVEIALPFLTPEFSFQLRLTRRGTGGLDAGHHRADAGALPAGAGGREAGGEGPGPGDSGGRADADAAGAADGGGDFRLRGV